MILVKLLEAIHVRAELQNVLTRISVDMWLLLSRFGAFCFG